MIGPFLTRGLVMIFAYAYPAYECFKSVEMNKPDIEQLRFWCQYWILVAVLTVCEKIGDTCVSWVPMYNEAKLAFFIYLWYPKTKGTTYVYDSFFRPCVAKHETAIDQSLLELRTRAGDIAVLYCQRAASYGQTRIFEILQYVGSQSISRPRSDQPQLGSKTQEPMTINRKPAAKLPPLASSASSSTNKHDIHEELGNSQLSSSAIVSTGLNAPKTSAAQAISKVKPLNSTDAMQIETVSSTGNENVNPPSKEEALEESIRMTRGRLRRARAAPLP